MNRDRITKRLDILIRMMLDQQPGYGKIERKDQLLFMDSVGLSTGNMVRILGKFSKDVANHLKQVKFGIKKTNEKEKKDGRK